MKMINTNMFFWHKDDNMFTAEASTLRWNVGEWPLMFQMVSSKTGKVITVNAVREIRSNGADNELQAMVYKPLPVVGDPEFTVEIFND